MKSLYPPITICIPHWQVKRLITICLRSIRKHSAKYDLQVIVVDNGSKDESLDYLRSLKWIKLVERPEETNANWPANVFSAWKHALRLATGKYYVVMHTDVFVKSDDWLDDYINLIESDVNCAGVGCSKLKIENPIYAFQKHHLGSIANSVKRLFGKHKYTYDEKPPHPRDYCAMYRKDVLEKCDVSFGFGGYETARQLWGFGYKTALAPVERMINKIIHIDHATGSIGPGRQLSDKRKLKQIRNIAESLFDEPWVKELENDSSLDS